VQLQLMTAYVRCRLLVSVGLNSVPNITVFCVANLCNIVTVTEVSELTAVFSKTSTNSYKTTRRYVSPVTFVVSTASIQTVESFFK
jgi:hypothetical protein